MRKLSRHILLQFLFIFCLLFGLIFSAQQQITKLKQLEGVNAEQLGTLLQSIYAFPRNTKLSIRDDIQNRVAPMGWKIMETDNLGLYDLHVVHFSKTVNSKTVNVIAFRGIGFAHENLKSSPQQQQQDELEVVSDLSEAELMAQNTFLDNEEQRLLVNYEDVCLTIHFALSSETKVGVNQKAWDSAKNSFQSMLHQERIYGYDKTMDKQLLKQCAHISLAPVLQNAYQFISTQCKQEQCILIGHSLLGSSLAESMALQTGFPTIVFGSSPLTSTWLQSDPKTSGKEFIEAWFEGKENKLTHVNHATGQYPFLLHISHVFDPYVALPCPVHSETEFTLCLKKTNAICNVTSEELKQLFDLESTHNFECMLQYSFNGTCVLQTHYPFWLPYYGKIADLYCGEKLIDASVKSTKFLVMGSIFVVVFSLLLVIFTVVQWDLF